MLQDGHFFSVLKELSGHSFPGFKESKRDFVTFDLVYRQLTKHEEIFSTDPFWISHQREFDCLLPDLIPG